MPDDSSDDDDDSVGYGRPPKHTRWKRGQSGNPSGKRKRDETIFEKLSRIAREDIPVTQNGSQTVMPADEAMLRTARHMAIKGDMRALKLMLDHLGKIGGGASAVPDLVSSVADIEVLRSHADWIGMVEQATAESRAADGTGSDEADDAEDDQ